MNPVILGELLAGFARGGKKKKNEEELQLFLDSPRVVTISIDPGTAERYSAILDSLWKAGTPIPTNDIWIAASVMQYGLEVLTTDVHYKNVPQIIVHSVNQDRK